MQKYSNKYRKILFDKIINLSETEHEEIYKIIRDNDISFTQNKNGIFFNLSTIDDELIDEIDKFVVYCLNNKTILDEYDKKLNECKINNNFDNIIPSNESDQFMEHSVKSSKEDEEWMCLSTLENRKMQKIQVFIDKMSTDRDKIWKKKMNVKFHNARKKYSKKIMTDKRIDNEDNELFKE
jgi:hypothetical protein